MSRTSSSSLDAIVIGSGQAGKPLATSLAGAGWRTALIEREHVGGTCINVGCTPTKTMVASARLAYLTRRASEYGVHAGSVTVDLAEVRRRKQNVVLAFRNGSQRRLEKIVNLDLIFGEASFEGRQTVKVCRNDGTVSHLRADRIFINVGCRPEPPRVEGLDSIPALDSSSIMELGVLPEHLIVVGGGYIGVEFGQMFRRFGSRVTLVHRGAQLLAREDEDVAAEVASILREDGLTVLLDTRPLRARSATGGGIELDVLTPDGERTLDGSHLLAATGRVPNTNRLDLAAAGVRTDPRGFIQVNDRLETGVPGIYALGDVKGGPAFTHISYDDFRILRSNLLEGGHVSVTGRRVPYVVFMDPQLGRIGMSEDEARAQGRRIRVAKLPMAHVARAIEVGETRGFMKAVVDAETDQILGYAALGIEGGELMSAVQLAMMGRVPYTALRDGIFAHPTLAESLNNLFMTLDA